MAPDLTLDRARPATARQVAAADPAIPALGDVLDLDRLTARLADATGAPGTVSLPYLRYKPGTSVVLSCRWTGGVAGRPRDLLVRAYAAGSRGKLDKGLDPRRPGEVLLLDREAGLVVTDWAADRQLPAARDAADLAADVVGRPADPRLLRHNPERRAVLYARGPRGEALLRLVRPDAVAPAVRGYVLLGAVADGNHLSAPRLRAVDADRGVVVTDWVPGRSLDRLDAAGTLDDAALREVGALAAALHGARPAGAGIPPRPDGAVPVHGDLSLDQLVRTPGGGLALVDGDAARWGRPADDLGSLAGALVRAHGEVDAAAARLAAVLDGYAGAGAGPVAEAELRAAVVEHLRRRAGEPFRRLEDGWAATSAALRELADDLADGRGGALGAAMTAGRRRGIPLAAVRPGRSRAPSALGEPAVPDGPRIRTAPVAEALADALAAQGHALRAVLPRTADRLLVVGTDRDGAVLAGRWDAGPVTPPARGAGVRTGGDPAHARGPVPVAGGALVLQPDGADPRLPGLAARVRAGATLVAHRSGRRGVVREPAGTYTKVTRPGREPADVAVPPAAFATPEVQDRGEGFVTTVPLPGRTLHELLRDPATPDTLLAAAGETIGRGLRRLQAAPPPDVAEHDAAAEVGVVARWWGLAVAHGATSAADAEAVVRRVRVALAAAPAAPAVLTHRDLHDKQLLVHVEGHAGDGDGVRAGLLDLDLAALAHPALDLANLIVHLELRAHQGVCPPERAALVASAVVDGYRPEPDGAALHAFAVAARARLAAVYAFRPAPRDVPGALLTDLDRPLPFEPTLLTLEDR
ncbi:phosphotransferase [Isoptericola sp. NPDC019693]|uniref:phosphotransferase n=1 Tax=Isoptericola sp. NPDC019693 TaxID=3364009 RepID=UPI00379146BC